MRGTVHIALDLLREAAARKWFLALFGGISLILVVLGLSLELTVVDGALAASRFFGKAMNNDIRSVDVALRRVYEAVSYLIFYGGTAMLVIGTADFAPTLLQPGRIEHLLSLPLRRFELILGTFLGVLVLGLSATLYAAGGLVAILALKTGSFTAGPLVAAALSALAFATLYSVMLVCAVLFRSAAVGALAGGITFVLGLVASYREHVSTLFSSDVAKRIFGVATLPIPRIATLANVAADFAGSQPFNEPLPRLLGGFFVFTAAGLALAIFWFEGKDY